MRPTYALRTISDLAPGDHVCCLYERDEERRSLLTPYVRQGLERGEKVLYVVGADIAEAVLGYLRDDGLAVDPHLISGQMSILAVDEAFKREGVSGPEGMITLLRSESERALAEGYTTLRVTGDMMWALAGLPDSNRLIEYEAMLNTFYHDSKCLGICLYDRGRFDPAVLLGVLATHPMVVVGAGLYDNLYYVPPSDYLGRDLPAATVRHWLENLKNVAARIRAEEALRRTHDQLEQGVQERTAELSRAIEFLEEQIAERKRVQEALHESKEHFRRLVETVNVIPWEADLATWRFTYVGPQAVRILGYPAEEWLEDGFWVNHIHPDDREYAVKHCLEASSQRQDFEFEYRILAADGRVVWMRDIVTVVPRVGGSSKLRGFMLDITEPKRIEEQLRSSQDQLRALSGHLRAVQEEERARIAREVHDELGQALTALKIDLAWVGQRLAGEQKELHAKVQTMTHLIDETVQAVRRIATELRPGLLDHLGLVPALEWQVREFQERTGLTCEFKKNPENLVVDAARATTVFRICQEALTNVARHAQATKVDISLRMAGRKLVLKVRDNGRGISEDAVADPRSVGLLGMRERVLSWGGEVQIQGVKGKGTVVTVHLPAGDEDPGHSGGLS